jgi:hypothetical protein
MKTQFRSWAEIFPLALIMLALVLAGCAAAGKARLDPGVHQTFRDLNVPPSYQYWFLNHENDPYAVVGLAPEWRIEDKMWRSVAPGSDEFRKVIGLVEDFPAPGLKTYGATLVDPQGAPIGIWLSSLTPGIQVDPENKLVDITTATPWMGGADGNGGRP